MSKMSKMVTFIIFITFVIFVNLVILVTFIIFIIFVIFIIFIVLIIFVVFVVLFIWSFLLRQFFLFSIYFLYRFKNSIWWIYWIKSFPLLMCHPLLSSNFQFLPSDFNLKTSTMPITTTKTTTTKRIVGTIPMSTWFDCQDDPHVRIVGLSKCFLLHSKVLF